MTKKFKLDSNVKPLSGPDSPGAACDFKIEADGGTFWALRNTPELPVDIVGSQPTQAEIYAESLKYLKSDYLGPRECPWPTEANHYPYDLGVNPAMSIPLMLAMANARYKPEEKRGWRRYAGPNTLLFVGKVEDMVSDAVTFASAGVVSALIELDKPKPARRIAARVTARAAVRVAGLATKLAHLSRKIAPKATKENP